MYRVGKAGMLIVVTIEAQQLPITTISGIVVMIVVPMVDRELGQIEAVELPRTAAADPGIHL